MLAEHAYPLGRSEFEPVNGRFPRFALDGPRAVASRATPTPRTRSGAIPGACHVGRREGVR